MKSRIIDLKSLPKVHISSDYANDDEEPRELIIKCKLSEEYTEEDYQNDYKIYENNKIRNSWYKMLMYWEVEKDSYILPDDYAYIMVDGKVIARSVVYGHPFNGISDLGMDPKKKYVALDIENMLPLDWEEPVTIDTLNSKYPYFDWDGIKSGMLINDYDASCAIDDCFYQNSGEIDEYDVEQMMVDNNYDEKYWD